MTLKPINCTDSVAAAATAIVKPAENCTIVLESQLFEQLTLCMVVAALRHVINPPGCWFAARDTLPGACPSLLQTLAMQSQLGGTPAWHSRQ
jgi:hypothetical protein